MEVIENGKIEAPIEFDASFKTINGKKILVIKAKSEEITKPDGTKDVVITLPSLKLINKAVGLQKEKEN